MNPRNIAINISLAVSGVALWSFGANRLASEGDFDYRPNPLGLKISPYGQVIALAVQGGIDSDWHGTAHSQLLNGNTACPSRCLNGWPAIVMPSSLALNQSYCTDRPGSRACGKNTSFGGPWCARH